MREDAVELFGFADARELECFRMLIAVTGVGPKVARAILSNLTPDRFALAVAAGMSSRLPKRRRGPKLAQRILLELKDKLSGDAAVAVGGELPAMVTQVQTSGSEAIAALAALGYDQSQAAAAIARLDQSLTAEEMIKAALKSFAGGNNGGAITPDSM